MRKALALLLLILSPALLIAQTKPIPQTQPLVFTHVTVIDMTGAPPKPDMTVIITGARITALGKTDEVRVPEGAQVVDATGKFLIPGLWDMHLHTTYNKAQEIEEALFPALVANGVTGIRGPQSYRPIEQINEWRKRIAAGKLTGPRIYEGQNVDSRRPGGLRAIIVKDEPEARRAVQSIKQRGFDFVKVYSFLSREAYFAIADEAKKQWIPFAGHLPFSISAIEASDAGQKSIEHLANLWFECSSDADEIRKELIELFDKSGLDSSAREDARIRLQEKALNTYSERKAAEVFARFAKNDTWQCPTLVVDRFIAFSDDPAIRNDSRRKYIPLSKRTEPDAKALFEALSQRTPEQFAHMKRLYQKELEMVGAMQRAGVPLLAGSDAPYAGIFFPGFSLHDELSLLVKAGLTPIEALRAATSNPAKYFGLLDSLGTIEQGKIADLVLLEANPLDDINNTQRINAVIVNGRYLPKESLQKMLADVEAAAKRIEIALKCSVRLINL